MKVLKAANTSCLTGSLRPQTARCVPPGNVEPVQQAVLAARNPQAGQVLVALLAFMATVIALTTMATVITLTNALATSKYGSGQEALSTAELGVENAMIRLLRDPSYTGETLTIGTKTATVNVSGSATKTITSIGKSGDFRRTVQVTATYTNNVFTITNWSETP